MCKDRDGGGGQGLFIGSEGERAVDVQQMKRGGGRAGLVLSDAATSLRGAIAEGAHVPPL